ncbi:TIGR02117 family protein [uncultured Roseibium sp.]|uniref:TIGR02117 family protein n=1 Tax=uncultured Roseibium sp. TaxID=1936171 RepID=UPI002603BA85|nr:TIGR02117 family protein [uncultured Roseibium sp.]
MFLLIRRAIGGLCLVCILLVILMGLGTLVPRPFFESIQTEAREPDKKRTILVLSNPIHTDIALPADPDVLEAFSFVSDTGLALDFQGVFWVVFGWGGRSFYVETPTWGHLKPGPVIDALTWDKSVMHVRRTGPIAVELESVREVHLSEIEFDRLLDSIRLSFELDKNGDPIPIPNAAYDAHDIFFSAKSGFNALLGCNTWTARVLRTAGLQTGTWTPLPMTLNWSLDLHNHF